MGGNQNSLSLFHLWFHHLDVVWDNFFLKHFGTKCFCYKLIKKFIKMQVPFEKSNWEYILDVLFGRSFYDAKLFLSFSANIIRILFIVPYQTSMYNVTLILHSEKPVYRTQLQLEVNHDISLYYCVSDLRSNLR